MTEIVPIERLDLRFEPRPWPFADERRAEIDTHFAAKRRKNPTLWNGPVLLMHKHALADGVLRGAYLETDFASFLAWRDWSFPPAAMRDCFAAAALLTTDNAFLLGVMGTHTANAGQIYFPSGTVDLGDVVDGRVDLERNVRRELKEETDLDVDEFQPESGWYGVFAGPLIAQIKLIRTREDATRLRARILDNLSRQRQPELADIRIVRGPADLDPMMPPYVIAYLTQVWAGSD